MTVRKARIMYELHLPILMLAQLSLSKKGAAGCRVGINCFVIIEKKIFIKEFYLQLLFNKNFYNTGNC